MTTFARAIRKIDQAVQWEPCDIFYDSTLEYEEFDEPRGGFGLFGTEVRKGSIWNKHDNTSLGNNIEKLPTFLEVLIKSIYYTITWPPAVVIKLMWAIIKSIAIPRSFID